ncbi:MAG TPA: vWA domain-containing protein [Thermoanaerobaculia bacterium]|nr:vWA domain-containing protein [Thermoanaerobaculia bacterium]
MKRAVALLFASVLLPAAAFASESFILNIPQRFDASQEIGEVRIVLGLSAAPAGSQLVVNGAPPLNLGDTGTFAGDNVSFTAAAGNHVLITYVPKSNFGADFCAGANATPKNIPLRFSGAQDVVDYAMSSFVVGSPMVECSKVSKRVADTVATITPMADNVAPALDAIARGRLPLDVVLVLDKSGSMNDLPPDAGAGNVTTKVQILKSAVDAFVANWQMLDQPTADGGDWSGDRIGVVFFDSAAVAQTLAGADAPANFFVRRSAGWNPIINDVDSLTPGGSTSIGGGINTGMQQWVADPSNDATFVVVTDGIQNTAPLIQPTASGFLGLLPVAGLPQELRKRFIPILTIGFGTPAAVDEDLLRNIAFETSGRSYISVNATTLFDDFALTLVSILKGNTASLAARRRATLTGPGPGPLQRVTVDDSARRVVFSLQWTPPLSNALDLEVLPPGASAPATPASSRTLPQASIQSFDIPPDHPGTWNVRVKRSKKADTKGDVPYSLNVFFLERHLDYRLSVNPPHPKSGEKMTLRAEVSYGGKPLTRLPDGALRVQVQRPKAAIGSLLRELTEITKRGQSGDVKTPYENKVASLPRAALARILPSDAEALTLKEEGRGFYSVALDPATIPGQYALEAVLDWDDPRTGQVHREERVEQLVAVKADPAKTEIRATRSADRQSVQIAVVPRDQFGNALGPGYESKVTARLTTKSGKLTGPTDTRVNGTYHFTLAGLPRDERPNAEISVDGVVVGDLRTIAAKAKR